MDAELTTNQAIGQATIQPTNLNNKPLYGVCCWNIKQWSYFIGIYDIAMAIVAQILFSLLPLYGGIRLYLVGTGFGSAIGLFIATLLAILFFKGIRQERPNYILLYLVIYWIWIFIKAIVIVIFLIFYYAKTSGCGSNLAEYVPLIMIGVTIVTFRALLQIILHKTYRYLSDEVEMSRNARAIGQTTIQPSDLNDNNPLYRLFCWHIKQWSYFTGVYDLIMVIVGIIISIVLLIFAGYTVGAIIGFLVSLTITVILAISLFKGIKQERSSYIHLYLVIYWIWIFIKAIVIYISLVSYARNFYKYCEFNMAEYVALVMFCMAAITFRIFLQIILCKTYHYLYDKEDMSGNYVYEQVVVSTTTGPVTTTVRKKKTRTETHSVLYQA